MTVQRVDKQIDMMSELLHVLEAVLIQAHSNLSTGRPQTHFKDVED
jgi:hypothetical protein